MRHLLLLCTLATIGAAAEPDVGFLTVEQARVAIVDETVEPYFSLLQPTEMAAKTGAVVGGATLEAQRDECRRRYRAAVAAFAPAEEAAIRKVIAAVDPLLVESYPRFAAEPWRFIKLDSRFEGGMPHTRGHCIVLSDAVLPGLVRAAKGFGVDLAGTTLLVHEQTHVVQRLHPAWFVPLYTGPWHFVRIDPAPAPVGELLAGQLVNPDGVDCGWAFPFTSGTATVLIQPLVIIRVGQPVPRMPADFQVVAMMLEKRGDGYGYALHEGEPMTVPLAEMPMYQEAYAPSEENFHPNEICAELFSRMVTSDLVLRKIDETACQQALRAWAKREFAVSAAAEAAPAK